MTSLTTARAVDDEELAWRSARNTEAADRISAIGTRQSLLASCRDALAGSELTLPITRGSLTFQLCPLSPGQSPSLVVTTEGRSRALVDAYADPDDPAQLSQLEVSPDGEFAAVAVSQAGAEDLRLHVFRVSDGSQVWAGGLADGVMLVRWSADSSTLWLVRRLVSEGRMRIEVVRQPITETELAVAEAVTPSGFVTEITISSDNSTVILQTGNTEAKAELILREGVWRPFIGGLPGSQQGVLADGAFLAVVDGWSPRGELVRIPLETAADRGTWATLFPAGDDILRTVTLVGDRLVLGRMRDAAVTLEVRKLDGTLDHVIALPDDEGTIGVSSFAVSIAWIPLVTVDGDSIQFIHSTPTSPPAAYRYSVKDRLLTTIAKAEGGARNFTVESLTAVGADGVGIPVTLISPAARAVRPGPLLLHAYGGFGLSLTLGWQAEHTAWVDAGGVLAIAHPRGGGELGRDWWRDGSQENGQRSADDLYTVAEFLIASGRTTSEKLGFEGASNGGFLAATAIAQRPDLWGAVVSQIPMTDLTAAAEDPLTRAILLSDFGDPDDPEVAARHRDTSPVALIRSGTRYPKTLVTAGENDPRCPVFHAASFSRLLNAADPDGEHLLRVYSGQGHGSAGVESAANNAADWLAFLAERLGLETAGE